MKTPRRSGLARWFGVLRLSVRQLQQRWLESVLIVLGLGLGVAVLTTGETFVRFQERMTVDLVAGLVREWEAVTARPASVDIGDSLFGPDRVPAVRVPSDVLKEPIRFTLEDLQSMRIDIPGVKYVTVQEGTWGSDIIALDDLPVDAGMFGASEDSDGMEPVETRSVTSDGFITVERVEMYTPPSTGPMLVLELVTPDEFGALGYEFLAGGSFTWDDFFAAERRIVLESSSAQRLFPGASPSEIVGKTVTTVGDGPRAEGNRWVVAGVLQFPEAARLVMGIGDGPEQSRRILAYTSATNRLSPAGSFVSGTEGSGADRFGWTSRRLYLTPEDDRFIPEIIAEVQAYFDQKYGSGRVELANPEAERASLVEGAGPVVVALLVLAGLGLVIAAVNVLNLFTARVMRRMRVTGMSIALGATRQWLFWQTAGEALLLGAAGSVLGVGLASGFVAGIRGLLIAQATGGGMSSELNLFGGFRVGPADALLGIAAGVGLSLIFGLYPAWLGSRQNPVEALRVE